MKSTWSAVVIASIGVLVGLLISNSPPAASARTAHGSGQKSMVTVPLDSDLEAVVTLDHRTGDLTGYVLNRFNGEFFIQYRYNVSQDFPESRGEYMVGAGLVDFRGFNSNDRLAEGVVYVSEQNSSQVAAYGIPWNPMLATSQAKPQQLAFVPLDKAQTRFTRLRD